ncbi:hypothetical protein CRUP_023457, partial [Coryphaenoides rupestris]
SRARKVTRVTKGSEVHPDHPDLRTEKSADLVPPCTSLEHRVSAFRI